MAKQRIYIGDPQPSPCPECEGFHGYQYTDRIRTGYTTIHESDGSHYGGQYSDWQPLIHKGKTAFCANCGERLEFMLIRKDTEELL